MSEIKDLQGAVSWASKVYRPSQHMTKTESVEWKAISKVVKRRDKHTCQSCGLTVGLSVHHILPRDEGGVDMPDNLITLCDNCHNEVEDMGLRDKWQIVDLKRKRKYIKGKLVENDKAIDWHQWVYGGSKRPNH